MKTKFVYLSILLAFSLSGVNAAVPDCQSVVIGSGVAGMKAAMDLKDGGNKVCLIEKNAFSGRRDELSGYILRGGRNKRTESRRKVYLG